MYPIDDNYTEIEHTREQVLFLSYMYDLYCTEIGKTTPQELSSINLMDKIKDCKVSADMQDKVLNLFNNYGVIDVNNISLLSLIESIAINIAKIKCTGNKTENIRFGIKKSREIDLMGENVMILGSGHKYCVEDLQTFLSLIANKDKMYMPYKAIMSQEQFAEKINYAVNAKREELAQSRNSNFKLLSKYILKLHLNIQEQLKPHIEDPCA